MESSPGDRRLGYLPALDGLRAVAVIGVLCFHSEFTWASGGFLGVSLFFTLSGFLITTIVLEGHATTGRVHLRAFYARRFRRLMPAALLVLAGVVVFGATVASATQMRSLQGDVWSALANVANWRMITAGHSYAEIFAAPSPVEHFWSLAIEEQFYWIMPLLVIALLRLGRGRHRLVGATFALLAVASTLWCAVVFNGGEQARAYYGTDTRAAELLIGCVLAVITIRRPQFGTATRRLLAGLGAVSLLGLLVLWNLAGSTDAFLYRGGFAACAVAGALVILGAQQPGPLRSVLAWKPLVLLGTISYGVYLIHWPIFLWLSPARTGLAPWPLFGLRLAVTLAAAVLSYATVETAIRRPGASPRRKFAAAAVACVMGMFMVATVTQLQPAPSTPASASPRLPAGVQSP